MSFCVSHSPEALQRRVEMTDCAAQRRYSKALISRLSIPAGRTLLLQDLKKQNHRGHCTPTCSKLWIKSCRGYLGEKLSAVQA